MKTFRVPALAAAFALLAACQSPPSAPDAKVAAPAPSAVKYMPVGGARLPWVEQGRGQPVVFVHGAVSDWRTWDRQRAGIAGQYRAISYTQRYFGTEPWDANGPKFGAQVHADDLEAFLTGLGAGPVHLVSWSYSGHVVLAVAAKRPDLVKSAFVFEPDAPTWISDAATLKTIGDESGKAFGAVAGAVQRGDNRGAARLLIDTVAAQDGYFDALPAAAQQIVFDSAPSMPGLFSAEPLSLSCEQLGRLRMPVALVTGDRTLIGFRLVARAAARCTPDHQLIVAPGGGHMWPGADVPAFNRTLLAFLNQQ